MLNLPERSRGLVITLKNKAESVRHNCDKGHIWFAKMTPITKDFKDPWRYCISREKFCPICGGNQSDNELI